MDFKKNDIIIFKKYKFKNRHKRQAA